MKLTQSCPVCTKTLEMHHQERIGAEILKVYLCGHAFTDAALDAAKASTLNLTSVDGKYKARPYQVTTIVKILDSGFKFIVGHQMRLGKTPCALLAAKNSDRFPVLVLVRSANLMQWKRAVNMWASNSLKATWVIQGTKGIIIPGFQYYLCSMDTFSRKGMSDQLLEFGFKLVIVDECHSFKNTTSNRSQALLAFLKEIEREELEQTWSFQCPFCNPKIDWTEQVTIKISTLEGHKRTTKTSHCPNCFAQVSQTAAAHVKVSRNCGVIMLSGTPIKNRADEWFVPLNIVAPDAVPSQAGLCRQWLIKDSKNRYSRVNPHRMEAFKQMIEPYYYRVEAEDVYSDVPKRNRIFTPIEVKDAALAKAYNQVLDEIEIEQLQAGKQLTYFESIGHLQKLRQICGLAKVQYVTEYAEEFLENSETKKLAIAYHHHSVRDDLRLNLAHLGVKKLDGQDNAATKDHIAHRDFPRSQDQLLLLGIQAAKEGMELPYIDTMVIMEREFTSTEEEQLEFRIYNPDKDYLARIPEMFPGVDPNRNWREKISNLEYVVAIGTIDEWMYNLVEEKRAIFGETIGTNWDLSQDAGSFAQLMEQTLNNRLKVAA